MEKLSSMKLVPGAKRVGDPLLYKISYENLVHIGFSEHIMFFLSLLNLLMVVLRVRATHKDHIALPSFTVLTKIRGKERVNLLVVGRNFYPPKQESSDF